MPKVDLSFSIMGEHLPADHGYLVYSAVSRLLPAAHEAEANPGRGSGDSYGIHPIRGRQLGGRTLQLTEHSRLVIRADANEIARFLPLAGKRLQLLDRSFCIGVPEVHAIVPAPALRSRLVTIKLADVAKSPLPPGEGRVRAANTFRAAALRKLGELGISGEPEASASGCSAQLTLGKRRTLRIKDKEVVGYEVLVEGLTAAESIALQEHGLGGRRHMGCGIFVPFTGREASHDL